MNVKAFIIVPEDMLPRVNTYTKRMERKDGFRGTNGAPERIMYCSRGTLIVIPGVLIQQWNQEYAKHINIDRRNTLKIRTLTRKIPSAEILRSYDIVLLSSEKFAVEASKFDTIFQGRARECNCPYEGRTRIKNCTCKEEEEEDKRSELLKVYWKRVIFDEGHKVGVSAGNTLTRLASLMTAHIR